MQTRRSCLALPFLLLGAGPLRAQTYPSRPVTLVVPYAAGGTADILARLVGEGLAAELGRSVVVENKPGASGTIGANAVAKADPDGHTLLFTAGGPLTIGPYLVKNPPYRPDTDFTPIGLVTQVPSFLVVNPRSGYASLSELIAAGRAQPGKLQFASPGVGTSVHLLAEMIRLEAGLHAAHVPYRGGAPAVNDLVGGHVDFLVENVPQLLPQVQAGALKALAVTSPRRLAGAPEVPTLEEAGIRDVGVGTWYGLLGPSRLPSHVSTQLETALQKLVSGAAFHKRLAELAVELDFQQGTAFGHFIRAVALDDRARRYLCSPVRSGGGAPLTILQNP